MYSVVITACSMALRTKILLVMFTLLLKSVLSANILYVAPLASPSHYLWNKAFSMALIERGHNITILTHDIEKGSTPNNYTVITMEGFYDVIHDVFDFEQVMHESILSSIKSLYDYAKVSCEYDLNTQGLEILLNYPKDYKFDLILFDVTFGQCLYPLIDRFNKPPVVAVTAFSLPPVLSHSFGNHLYTSYMPYYSTKFTNKMSFTERFLNFIYIYTEIFYRNYISASVEYNLSKKRFGENIRTPEEVERSMSLLLSNIDPVLDYPIALAPNIIPIGGLHIKPAQDLPEDILNIMNKAKNGVILLSFGTNIKFSMLKPSQREALFKSLAKLPQIILWKIESNNLEGIPENVVIRKWLPQNDILSHPNIKLFISHGGCLSTQEAMYHGVPVVGIPFIIDQYVNIRKLEQKKLAKYLNHASLTPENVYETIKEVLDNPIYANNMKSISKTFRDQPQTPLERGIFWLEYILRHGTAEHLVLPARDMPVYQICNFDVLAGIFLGIFFLCNFVMLILTCCRFIITLLRRDTKSNLSKKNN